MKRIYLLPSLMVTLCFSSCTKDNDIINDTDKKVELSFNGDIEGLENKALNSRTIINYTGENPGDNTKWPNAVSFDDDEAICVFPKKTNPSNNKFQNSSNNITKFRGKISQEDVDSNDGYIVVYPYNEQNSIDYIDANNFTIRIHIPIEQKMNNENNIDNNPSFAFIGSGDKTFILGNAASLLRICFLGSQDKLSMIKELTLKTQYNIVGILQIPYSNGKRGTITAEKNNVKILPPDDGFKIGQGYYVVVRGQTQPSAVLTATLNNTKTVDLFRFDDANQLIISGPTVVTPINITL